jgi:AcrR family transcriptional regulator
MPKRGDRGGSQTRARIAEAATRLFLERGFDAVTIAEVAAAAGVSKVTVFTHFERKEDLLLDRLPGAVDLLRAAIRDRGDLGVVDAALSTALNLAEQRHPLSGLSAEARPFLRTVMSSPALIARLRAFAYEIETELAAVLQADPRFHGDSTLVAALLVTAYRTVAVETARRLLAGDDLDDVAGTHRDRLREAFDLLTTGLPADLSTPV